MYRHTGMTCGKQNTILGISAGHNKNTGLLWKEWIKKVIRTFKGVLTRNLATIALKNTDFSSYTAKLKSITKKGIDTYIYSTS